MSINLTPAALAEIQRVMSAQNLDPNLKAVELGVVGGGCAGYQYRMGFVEKSDVDRLNTTSYFFEGIEAVVDNRSMTLLEGVNVDYHADLERRGFVFDNPSATRGCGCGQSFSCGKF